MALPTQQFVDIQEIRNGIVILKNGTYVSLLLISPVNLYLKSSDEQEATLSSFQSFLNTLDFHVQISVQSRRLDIRPYLRSLEERLLEQKEELLKIQTQEYIEFIKTFSTEVNVMVKNFFVVVPYTPPALDTKNGGFFGMFKTQKEVITDPIEFERQRSQIDERISVVSQGLSRMGMNVQMLDTETILELFASIYNPGDSQKEIR